MKQNTLATLLALAALGASAQFTTAWAQPAQAAAQAPVQAGEVARH